MTEFNIIFSLCTITKMPEQQLSQKLEMTFHQPRMFFDIRIKFFKLIYFSTNLPKNICDRLKSNTANAMDERITGLDIQFYSSHAGTILAAVMLFFHEQVELVQPPHRRSILLLII